MCIAGEVKRNGLHQWWLGEVLQLCCCFAGVLWEWRLELDPGDAEVLPRAALLDLGPPDLSVSDGQVTLLACSSHCTT